ncbi:MAG: cadmium-translocating P-type ATPase [Clostridia bacterium]|nr:cadmium-translocating P-type ATPase [Clostridia bacterium]
MENGKEQVNVRQEKMVLHIENLDCPVCAEALQSDIQKIKGVRFVAVDFVSQTITLETESESVLKKVVKTANSFEEVRVLDGGRYAIKRKSRAKEWLQIFISAALLIAGVLLFYFIDGKWEELAACAAFALAYICVGYPVLISTAKNVCKGRIFDENFLMTVASIGAFALGEYWEGVLVMLLYQLGELLQSIAVESSRNSVAKLMELKSESATLIVDGEYRQVKPEEIQVGDKLLVKAGEKAPVDGLLLTQKALLDTKSMTGEGTLREILKGGEILSGTINAGGVYEMKAIRAYADSAVARVLDLVENVAASKAKPEKFIAKFARIYTPVVCLCALLLGAFAPLVNGWINGYTFKFLRVERWVRSALTFLVVSCPCALVISVPLTYFSGIGACAKAGVLVKGATYLDALARVKNIAFDKTGTLTEGNFTVCGVDCIATNEQELIAIAAAVERESAHPIAKAFENCPTSYKATNVVECVGKGLAAKIDGKEILIGNEALLAEHGVCVVKNENSVYTQIFVAQSGEFLGVIYVGDKIKAEAKGVLEELKILGFHRRVMLTGDRKERAENIANEIGMSEVNAELLPDEKLKKAEEFKHNGGFVYVGDGINDAPVMTLADCAVSMGKLGSAAAIEASDLVLISDRLSALPKAVKISRRTRKIVMQNVVFSIVMKGVFMALGALGVLPLWLAVFADVGVMLLAVLNSFRVRND